MKYYLITAFAIVITFSACVPKKELLSAQKHVKNLQADSTATHSGLSNCNSHVDSLEKFKMALQAKLANCNYSLDSLEKYKTFLQDSINNLSSNYKSNESFSKKTIEAQAKQLKYLQDLIQRQKDVMNNLKKTIADALINFKPDELTVTLKDGKLYVSLQEKLLFKSGSAVVDPKGKEALKNLAAVLNKTSGITITVEGHTDTVPITTGKYEDNWALSTARATSIVRILTKDYGVNPHNIIASGRSKYYPVADNSTPEGRAKNRRTEIILSPDLTELFKLLDQ